jgi:dolichyl-phosphate-mannose-protein mannosyltransferase
VTRPGPLLLAALGVAFACRVGFAFLYWHDKPLTRDEVEYLDLAQQVATGHGLHYPDDAADRFSRAPLYPLFAAVVLRASGNERTAFTSTPAPLKLTQSALGVLSVWLLGCLAGRYAGPRGAIAAAWIAAVYPPLVWLSAYAFSESLYIPLALSAVVLLTRPVDEEESSPAATRLTVIGGLLCGLAALTRPAHLAFLACATLWMLWRRQAQRAAILCAAAILVIIPWTIRNYREHGRVILIAAEGGVTFWTGNHPLAPGEGDLAANPQLKMSDLEFRAAHPGLSAEQLEPLYYRAAFAWIREHPLDWAVLVARKLFYVFVPIGPSYLLHSTRYIVLSLLSYGVLVPLGIAGAWKLRRRSPAPRTLALFVAAGVLTALAFMPQERFRIPVLDTALIVCAGRLARSEPESSRTGAAGSADLR